MCRTIHPTYSTDELTTWSPKDGVLLDPTGIQGVSRKHASSISFEKTKQNKKTATLSRGIKEGRM